ncbi:hypothetical protein [Taibaiella soli]|uniref:Uncharacterized protein n=1 Tax=Taibaiella soli TaxID=1649169 RepID=A0A2W2BBA7_9BACT|nr:hypothetical protein [Taibaiella soli]PZF73177.1 hypothetical protein DN068_09915 [Taibaiella soli]
MIPQRKKALLALGLIAVASFTACKKDDSGSKVKPPVSTARSVEDSRQLLADIQTFYSNMQVIRDGKDPGSNVISFDDAEFLTEATYNYYLARNDYDYATTAVNFSIPAPVTDGGVQMKDVTNAFWQIKDNLMKTYDQINYADKGLALFDLKLNVVDDRNISFDVYATIKTGPAPTIPASEIGGVKTAVGTPNHAWNAKNSAPLNGQGNNGQCDLDLATGTIVPGSQSSSVPSAATVLRQLGIANYWGWNPPAIKNGQLIAYQQTVTKVDDLVYNLSGCVISSPVSDYNQRQIAGYMNTRIWSCEEFYTGANIDDANKDYKSWLTTPNLNFYLGFIPTIINEAKGSLLMPPNSGLSPSSYVLDDFGIEWKGGAGGIQAAAPPFNRPFVNQRHEYKITYGVITGVPLPPAGDLSGLH